MIPLDASLSPDKNDYQDPVTRPWIDLLKLYVVADKYDTRSLRMATLDIIQLKLCQTIPRKYAGPHVFDPRCLPIRLPVSSPLYRSSTPRPPGSTSESWALSEIIKLQTSRSCLSITFRRVLSQGSATTARGRARVANVAAPAAERQTTM